MTHSWIFVLSLSVLYTLFLYFYIAALPLTAYSLFFLYFFFFLMIRRPPRSTHCISSAASDVYKRQNQNNKKKGKLQIRNFSFTITQNVYELCMLQSYFFFAVYNELFFYFKLLQQKKKIFFFFFFQFLIQKLFFFFFFLQSLAFWNSFEFNYQFQSLSIIIEFFSFSEDFFNSSQFLIYKVLGLSLIHI
eukprot:TRINITY_DN1403_c0_g1_i22.p1 TRINITY_DN1403_c0_g1~~TRINITY_DN1403_c0_g1_i22.p1  ORF type:complete len:190 (-),score=50.09 TRINITY_DN1403_c0_g1_i22:178-747(-)